MGVAGALAVAPGLILRPRDLALEAALLSELATWAESFSPNLSLSPPDAVLVEASASLLLFGGPRKLLARLQAGSAALGLPARVAAAPTPLAARWLARLQPGSLHAGPRWTRTLDDLPLDILADAELVPAATLDLLRGLGLSRLGQIDALPRDGLARREAALLPTLLARARGTQPDPRPWFQPPERYQARTQLPVPVCHTEPLLFAIGRLIQGLTDWLAPRQGGIDQCRIVLEHEAQADSVLDVVTGRPGRDAPRLSLLVREHLSAFALPAPVEALRIEAHAPRPLAPRNGDLFDNPDSLAEQGEQLIERLRARLGAEALYALQLAADHRPERAWRDAPLGKPSPAAPDTLPPRPLWLLPTPRALGAHPRLELLRGPERVETGWWDGQPVTRDYYAARAGDGALWWVYQEHGEAGAWYLHGYFS